MRVLFLLAACAFCPSLALALNDYVPVPDGWLLHSSCIFNHPTGHIDRTRNYTCDYPGYRAPREQVYRMDTHLGNASTRQTSFNASWVVPALPEKYSFQVVYFWPGFKQSSPEMGYPVFQPVLQYGQHGSTWEFQSWFVYGQQGIAHTGIVIKVSEGHELVTYMSFEESTGIWTCYGVDAQTGQSSLLTQEASQMGGTTFFEYSMLVLETIGVSKCSELPPTNKVEFTGVSVNGVSPDWTPRVTRDSCGEKIDSTPDTVTMSWSATA